MKIEDLQEGEEYLRIHAYTGQDTQHIKILSKTEKEVSFIQTYPKELHKGYGQVDTFNIIECERYLCKLK